MREDVPRIQERLYFLYKEKKQPFLLAVDKAQYLNYSILRDLKMLMNYNYDSLNCFSLILVGEPYLNHILEKQVHEALRQRITVHYNREGNKVSLIAASFAAGSFCAAVRANNQKQGVVQKTPPESFSDMQDCIFQLAVKGI